jgi:5'-phosphate synthase pdxT subunit
MAVPTVGVLALQGAVTPHLRALSSLGAETLPVRDPQALDRVDALVLPGGESTTMSMLLDRTELREPLAKRLDSGLPVFGTCAGMILLAGRVLDGRDDQQSFGALDITVRRNAFGRQVDSFETDLDVTGLDAPFHAVFIRAPVVEEAAADVEVLARVGDRPVLCRHGDTLVTSFHPELTDDARIHRLFLDQVA